MNDSIPSVLLRTQGRIPVRTVFGIGRNYAAHARELGNFAPREPVVFLKAAGSLLPDGGVIRLPPESQDVQHEVEMVLLLSQGGRHAPVEQAMQWIAGYGVGIDVTARDLQRRAQAEGNPWAIAKGIDGFGPVSEFLPAGEILDPAKLEFDLTVNGQLRQAGHTRDMLFGFDELIAYLSRFFTLHPGDLIFTGTPQGVARMQAGDVLRAKLRGYDLDLAVRVEAG